MDYSKLIRAAGWFGIVGGILLMLGSILMLGSSLVSIWDVFTEAYATVHMVFPSIIFALGVIGVLVVGITFIQMKKKTKGCLSIFAGVISLLVMFIPWHHWMGLGVTVLLRTVASIVFGVWIVCTSASLRRYGHTSSKLTQAEVTQCANLLQTKHGLLEDNAVLVEYWKKVKETIHLFDGIIVKYVIQWSAVLLAIVGASTIVFSSRTPEFDFSLLAGIIALTAILISVPIAIKCWFYYDLLEEALRVANDIEKIMFHNNKYDKLAKKVGLTLRLTEISTKPRLRIGTFFGWTIFIPFALLFMVSFALMLYYFNHAFGWGI